MSVLMFTHVLGMGRTIDGGNQVLHDINFGMIARLNKCRDRAANPCEPKECFFVI